MFGLCAPIDVEPNACSEARSQSLWSDARSQNDCIGYKAFIAACPNAPEAQLAEASLQRLSCGGGAEEIKKISWKQIEGIYMVPKECKRAFEDCNCNWVKFELNKGRYSVIADCHNVVDGLRL